MMCVVSEKDGRSAPPLLVKRPAFEVGSCVVAKRHMTTCWNHGRGWKADRQNQEIPVTIGYLRVLRETHQVQPFLLVRFQHFFLIHPSMHFSVGAPIGTNYCVGCIDVSKKCQITAKKQR